MAGPQAGDVLIRVQTNTPTTYRLVDIQTQSVVGGPLDSLADAAIAAAKKVGPIGSVWQETVDERGRPLTPVVRFPARRG